jgi:hypothetical protein
MVMMTSETQGGGAPPDLFDDEEDHDGWGPVRPRRSSMPVPLAAHAPSDGTERLDQAPKNTESPLKS